MSPHIPSINESQSPYHTKIDVYWSYQELLVKFEMYSKWETGGVFRVIYIAALVECGVSAERGVMLFPSYARFIYWLSSEGNSIPILNSYRSEIICLLIILIHQDYFLTTSSSWGPTHTHGVTFPCNSNKQFRSWMECWPRMHNSKLLPIRLR